MPTADPPPPSSAPSPSASSQGLDAFAASMAVRVARIDAALPGLVPELDPPIAVLRDACRYALMAGGKRVRPLLVMLAAEVAAADSAQPLDDEVVVRIACAWEFVHTYSLVHDDLPAMDDDDIRRGRPTTHKVYGEANAILVGDALLTEAFAILAAHAPTPALAQALVRELAAGAGAGGMVGGQVADLAHEGGHGGGRDTSSPAEALAFIHQRKTGALLRSAVRAGALLGGATHAMLAALTDYGRSLGLAFQVVDDILDITQTTATLGKSAGKDLAADKLTYPAVHGLDESRRIALRLHEAALAAIAPLGPGAANLRQLAHYVIHRAR